MYCPNGLFRRNSHTHEPGKALAIACDYRRLPKDGNQGVGPAVGRTEFPQACFQVVKKALGVSIDRCMDEAPPDIPGEGTRRQINVVAGNYFDSPFTQGVGNYERNETSAVHDDNRRRG